MNTIYWLNKIMDNIYTSGATEFWLGLSSVLPSADGSGVIEPEGNNYNRVKINGFTAPTDGVVKNSSELNFPKSTGVWFPSENKAAYWLLFNGSDSSASLLSCGMLLEAKTVESDTVITIPAETLSIALTDYSSAIV